MGQGELAESFNDLYSRLNPRAAAVARQAKVSRLEEARLEPPRRLTVPEFSIGPGRRARCMPLENQPRVPTVTQGSALLSSRPSAVEDASGSADVHVERDPVVGVPGHP